MVQLGRTLALLAEVARSGGLHAVAADTATERLQIVERIGPEVRSLEWARAGLAAKHDPHPAYAGGLTERELEVLRLVSRGQSNAEIADELTLSVRTVERHIANLYVKIDARNRADATAHALRHGLA
jgi:DNA-binding NarL/FixJ family response regulator